MKARQGKAATGRAHRKSRRATTARIGAGLALALLAGCATRGEIDRFSAVRDVSPREAFVMPGAGGPSILGVLERRYNNGVEQEIVLSGGGFVSSSNMMRVQFIGPVDESTSGRTALSERSLARTEIGRELRQEFPGVAMVRSPLYVQNRYGPFGYATGRSGATACLYAWQRMSGTDDATLILRPRGIINLRLRLCEAGASEAQLLSVMYGLGINAFLNHFSWVPYGAPPGPDASLGETGAPIYPVAPAGPPIGYTPPAPPEPVAAPPRPRRARPAAPRVERVAAPPPQVIQPLPAPVGPLVPPPPAAASAFPASAGLPAAAPASAASPGIPAATAAGALTAPVAGTLPAATRPPVAPPAVCADGRLMSTSGC
ncbi:cellulose biosynthesis protein BcsN [Aureimonas ureilytica]|uniref:cellulose biosynthesis protein BcsN n=1 Tax=Aureimonas ureilytica TaxID=401562 RepID=UPI000A48C156|nr:cellulose biosynthesis protein BcsN [Aureimonas ureilytica]